jgi:CRISPR-associated protein Cas1
MRSLVIQGYGVKLGVKGNMFVIISKEKKEKVSPSDVDQIVLATSGINISSKALRLALQYGIDVVVLDSRGDPWGRLFHAVSIKTVETRKAQYLAIVQGNDYFGREMIRAKIMNQAGHLKYWSRRLGIRLDYKEVESKDNEALAARIYWQSLAEVLPKDIKFEGRDQDSNDVFNISLNYSYALLYFQCHKALQLVGLDPYAGFIHKDKSGKESLVYDFSEMFKPSCVDFPLVKAFVEGFRPKVNNGLLDPKSRAEIIKIIVENFNKNVKDRDGNVRSLLQTIRAYAIKLASSLRGEEQFKGFVQLW